MEILSKKQEKLIRSLQQKKYRKQEQLFIVEGIKMVEEALKSEFDVEMIVLSKQEFEFDSSIRTYLVEENDMKSLSSLTTSPGVMAIVKQKKSIPFSYGGIVLALDKIQDPGNLGTIIRTADALGVNAIVCSKDTVDHYSPKVVQSTMGAIFRMNISYIDLVDFLKENKEQFSIYGTHLEGENIYDKKLSAPSIIAMGNESKGISEELMKEITNSIKIPIEDYAESFNVSIATAIVLSEFKRQFSLF